LITEEQLQQAIAIQKEKGGFLGQVLVQEGFVTQNAVASCLVKQCKIPHLSLLDYDISKEVLDLVPQEVCLKYRLLPIDKLGRILTLAMVDPLDLEALEKVRASCPELRIKPILCNWEHFQSVFSRVHGNRDSSGQASISMQSLGLKARPGTGAPAAEASQAPAPEAVAPASAGAEPAGMLEEAVSAKLANAASVPGVTPEELAAVMRESIQEAMAQTVGRQREQESRLAEIAEAMLQSVRQNSLLIEGNVVQEYAREDLQQPASKRHTSVVPFTQFQQKEKVFSDRGEIHRESDERVMEALYSEHPLETLTFDNFFPGEANGFTYKLGQAVAAQPGVEFNPFFLYGHVGIGKTHLISAIGNAILKDNPDHRVGYVSASHFARRLKEAGADGALDDFRENYAHWDVLILDDIQFMGGRVEAQEEFFHIFNVLYQQSRQVIIASDKAPDRLGLMEQRLISRFASGIVAALKAPEWEARMQILRHNLSQIKEEVKIPEEILSLIAMRVPDDVRKMTGALRKIMAFARLVGQQMSLEMADEILSHIGAKEAE